jgi:hypothetical protein
MNLDPISEKGNWVFFNNDEYWERFERRAKK